MRTAVPADHHALTATRAAWRLTSWSVALAALLLAPSPGVDAARLSQDGHVLILQDEAGAQHGVAATRDPSTAAREIRLTGKSVLPTLVLRCGTTERVIPLTATDTTAAGPVARYRVSEDLAQLTLRADCRLVLVGTFVPMPRDLLAQVWTPGQDAAAARGLEATVVSVVDGDTIRVRLSDRTEAVRYIGINTPELRHPTRGRDPGAQEAAEANAALVQGEHVRLELDVQERDRYGRLLAYVYVGETMINAELVRRGFAQVMTVPPNVRHQALFVRLQREAREHGRGLWASPEASESPPPPARTAARAPSGRPGVEPESAWACPASHPIKGNFTTSSGERCIYHPPGGQFYDRTKPERCYTSGDEARQDGCRRSRR